MSIFFTYNDKIYKEGTAVITPGNRSFRYGDGLFETIKVSNGKIQLATYHFDRLFSGMGTLQFDIPSHFTAAYLENKIAGLCKKNGHHAFARVRLVVFRGNGGLYDAENHIPNYIIQTWDLENAGELNSNGIILDVYPDAKKSCDKFANLKSNNFLPYVMAALYAKQQQVNDCVLLNSNNRICDTTMANIFIIKDGVIYTPPLSEGCVAGTMRRFLIEKLPAGFTIAEKPLTLEDLENADEVFLTNAIAGIRWVQQYKAATYSAQKIKEIHSFIMDELRKED